MGVYPLTNLFDVHTSYAAIELRVIVSSLSVRKQRIHLSDILYFNNNYRNIFDFK